MIPVHGCVFFIMDPEVRLNQYRVIVLILANIVPNLGIEGRELASQTRGNIRRDQYDNCFII